MGQPIKVLLVSVKSTQSHGGIAVWTRHYENGSAAQGIESELVNIEMIGTRATDGTAKRSFADEARRTKRIFAEMNKLLSDPAKSFHVAHLNTSCGTFGLFRDYLIAGRIHRKGIPVVTQFHRDVPAAMHSRVSRFFLKKLIKVSDRLLVLCENSKQYLARQFHADSIKVPNFIDASMIREEEKKINPELKKAVFVGRVQQTKGAFELYEAAKRLPDIQFELIGKPSEEILRLDVPENVQLLGGMPHEQVLEHLDDADIFVFPTYSEGFSMALMESMARGLPSVATDVGANKDMLDGGCGAVIPAKDVDALVEGIESLRPMELRASMSKNSAQKVQSQYTVDAVMQTIRDIYNEILQ